MRVMNTYVFYINAYDFYMNTYYVYMKTYDFYMKTYDLCMATYDFYIRTPSKNIQLAIHEFENAKHVLTATLSGKEECLNNDTIISAAIRYPFLTFKVIGAIHWNALLLWLKRVPLFHYPSTEN